MLSIGTTALNAMMQSRSGIVFGRTSRGDFVKLDTEEIIFLSFESYRGPLTINIRPVENICNRIQTGDRINIFNRGIYWPDYDWNLIYPSTESWAATIPDPNILSRAEIRANLRKTANSLFTIREASSISINLIPWLGLEPGLKTDDFHRLDIPSTSDQPPVEVARLLLEYFSPLIGLGGGLTPSGDDLILGFGLAAQRWSNLAHWKIDLNILAVPLFDLVNSRTTLLSRSLIREAWKGQADERLILALDGIVSGHIQIEEIVTALASWGNHSGGDALTGIALFILTLV